jgi:hypothetical protein
VFHSLTRLQRVLTRDWIDSSLLQLENKVHHFLATIHLTKLKKYLMATILCKLSAQLRNGRWECDEKISFPAPEYLNIGTRAEAVRVSICCHSLTMRGTAPEAVRESLHDR